MLRSVYLLILCLLVIIYWENSGEIFDYHCLFAYFFWLFEFCYMHFKALLVGVYTIKILRSSWGIVPFNIMKYHTLSLMIFIVLKSTLPGMNIAFWAFFWLVLAWYIFLCLSVYLFIYFSMCLYLEVFVFFFKDYIELGLAINLSLYSVLRVYIHVCF